jgi:SNF2 family DNA or RNA helicase
LLLREQSEDRNHRIGQTRPVFYYDFITQDTVDTMILDSLKQKKDLSVYVRNILKEGKDVF